MKITTFLKKAIKAVIPYGIVIFYRNSKNKNYKLGGGITPEDLQKQKDIHSKILLLKHQFAYNFALNFVKPNYKILDYGCGDGYGSNFYAIKGGNSVTVVGADADKQVIKDAIKKYKVKNLSFLPLNKLKSNFNLITSFQVIEHVPNVYEYLCFLKEKLSSNATLIISTPSRDYRLNENQKPWNKFHLREYNMLSFIEDIGKVFENAKFYSLSAIPEVLKIEFERVMNSREDKKMFQHAQYNTIQYNTI